MASLTSSISKTFRKAKQSLDELSRDFRQTFFPNSSELVVPPNRFRDALVFITPNEINALHGTGVILRNVFSDRNDSLSIRSSDLYKGHEPFVAYAIRFNHRGLERSESFRQLLQALRGNTFSDIICVPYLPDDLISAIVVKEAYNARLCVYIMDDNCLETGAISKGLMHETLKKADLRLAISEEMQSAYETAFNLPFQVQMPCVEPALFKTRSRAVDRAKARDARAVLVGNIWDNRLVDQLAGAVTAAGIQVDWYGNHDAAWLEVNSADLTRKGVHLCGFLPEQELAAKLENYTLALIPSGTLDEHDPRPNIALYSLPTRIPFLLAAGNLPIVVLGSPEGAAARFVVKTGVGVACPYDGATLRETIRRITEPEMYGRLRSAAADVAGRFSAAGIGEKILTLMKQNSGSR